MASLYASKFYGLDHMKDAVGDAAHPTYESTRPLEVAFAAMFADTAARVHTSVNHATQHVYPYVHTDRLGVSGNPSTDFDGKSWKGSITYGDETTQVSYANGTKTGNYAIYEMARGGDHNFFGGLPALEPTLLEAMKQHFVIRAKEGRIR